MKLQPPVVSTETLGHFASQLPSLLSFPCSLAHLLSPSLSLCLWLGLFYPLRDAGDDVLLSRILGLSFDSPFLSPLLVFLPVLFLCLVIFPLIFHSPNFLPEDSQALLFRAGLFCMAVFEQLGDHGW